MSYRQIKIGTRGSPLAMWQTNEVLRLIRRKFPSLNTKVIIIKTSGDKFSGSLSTTHDSRVTNHDYAGKGLFVKEMEEALASGRIDMAVHSLKDMPAILPKGLSLVAYLKREDPSDLFISKKSITLSSFALKATRIKSSSSLIKTPAHSYSSLKRPRKTTRTTVFSGLFSSRSFFIIMGFYFMTVISEIKDIGII